jgi:hypothetical protein
MRQNDSQIIEMDLLENLYLKYVEQSSDYLWISHKIRVRPREAVCRCMRLGSMAFTFFGVILGKVPKPNVNIT